MDGHNAKHRVDMLIKDLRKVQAYCAFWDSWGEECKLYPYSIAGNLDDEEET